MPITPPDEYLEVNSIPLVWWIELLDVLPLWNGADITDTDLPIPGANGERDLIQYLRPLRAVIPAIIYGDRDRDGGTVDGLQEQRQQLFDNVRYLLANVCADPGTDPSTRSATLYSPDGTSTLVGNVRVSRNLDLTHPGSTGEGGGNVVSAFAVLDIKVFPAELAESGS